MPLYEYYCEHNQQTVEVRHGMSERITTWEKLCSLAGIQVGNTPKNTEVKRVISGGMGIPRKSTEAKPNIPSPSHSSG